MAGATETQIGGGGEIITAEATEILTGEEIMAGGIEILILTEELM